MEVIKRRKLVWDLEANGLLKGNKRSEPVSKVWMIAAIDIETQEEFFFCNYVDDCPDLLEFKELFDNAKELIGHNIIQYDFPVLSKILDWQPKPNTVIKDTLLMSQVLDYSRFGGKHNLAVWGEYLGVPKPEHEDWLNFSLDMVHRCKQDVKINEKVYRLLMQEMSDTLGQMKNPEYLKKSMRVEHDLAIFQAEATQSGWAFNVAKAKQLEFEMECELARVKAIVEPKMNKRLKVIDKEPRKPKYRKNGTYMAATVSHFPDIECEDALTTQPILGEFQRIKYLDPDLGSIDYLKEYLYSIGWEPLDWNWERVINESGKSEFRKKSPKICDESLKALGSDGEAVLTFLTTRSRLGILQGWLANVDDDGQLRGDMFTIATPTGRARHKIIVNVPSPKAAWGEQMRALFGCPKGYKVVGADSSGNQFRALCHYIKDDEFTNEVINGDVHQKNADILGCPRHTAKPWIYAFLFGAGLEKLGLILTGKRDKKAGSESRAKFAAAIPGFKKLIDTLNEIVYSSEARDMRASIPALDGRRIYLDSGHKALNYLLQSAEGITCKAAVSYMMTKFKKENIDAKALIFYHDEVQWSVREDQAERAAEIAAEAFREAPKWYGVTCMDGEAMIGDNWYETH